MGGMLGRGMGSFGAPGSRDLGGQQDGPPGDDENDLLQELMEAAQAGDDAESDGMFSQVPGADGGEPQQDGGSSISPEMLQQLLMALKDKDDNSDASAPGGLGMPPGGA